MGGIFSDIGHFTDNVINGGEQVAKMAWQFTENAVQTVIHTAESIYNLVITDVEDAVTAVVGFLKTVVADIIKIIQWLSALFNWENILRNHAYIKQALANPGDPANPGILDRLATWVASELNGGTDTTTVLGQLAGQSSAAAGSTATATAGQTVQSAASRQQRPQPGLQHRRQQQRQPVHLDAPEGQRELRLRHDRRRFVGGTGGVLGPGADQRRIRAVPDRPGKRADRLVRRPSGADPAEDRLHPGQLLRPQIRAEHRPVGPDRRIRRAGR